MEQEKIALAQTIDDWVTGIIDNGGGDEQILEGMYDYMDIFKQLLDSCTSLEMTLLNQRFDGFYRFAHLLELLAQAIADGAIEVPPDVPLPKQQPQHPPQRRAKRRQAPPREQIRHAIDKLPLFTEMIMGTIQNTEEQYQSFLAARHKPHVLDDAIVDRALRLYQAQLADIALHERQMQWWLSESLSDAQRFQVKDLLAKLSGLRERTQALLDLLAELRLGTIDRILEMDDEELGRRVLRGDLGRPFT
jgi:hypothetical protein